MAKERAMRHLHKRETPCIQFPHIDLTKVENIEKLLDSNNIMVHICKKCNRMFRDISALKTHLNKKKISMQCDT